MSVPEGTITFLLTDVEGSTRLWEKHPGEMALALARHEAIVAEAVAAHGGAVLKTRGEGDSIFCVFGDASGALAAALALQRALAEEPWPEVAPIRVRVALHAGEAELRDGDYFGSTVNRAARLRAIAHGGQVVVSGAVAGLVGGALPGGASLADLGLHRLKDLARPERVYQLAHPGLAGDFPPLRSLEAARHNLPTQLTTFVGREDEIAEVRKLLGGSRLVTIVGAGGAGKTRLALQVAAEMLDEHPHGVWLAELAPVADPALVPHAVARAMGLREEPGRPIEATLADHLEGQAPLVVLDNCEHLVEACASLCDSLLRLCPAVRVLATSREPLGVPGELLWRIPSLPAPDPAASLPAEALAGFESVRLFCERASLVRPGFALRPEDASAVAEICHRLDGIPLAIELAAARVRVLSPGDIAARLDDRFRLLTGGSRTLLPRQQTLRALVEWSWDLLGDAEHILFERLGTFAGGFALEAAEDVCAGGQIASGDVIDLLAQLVDKSLVLAGDDSDPPRFRMLETLRAFVLERLSASGEEGPARNRHAGWCLALAEEAEPELRGPRLQEWLARLEAEHDNIRAALTWSLAGGDPEVALALGAALWRFWEPRAHLSEGRRWLEAALAATRPDAPARLRALTGAGALADTQGVFDEAEKFHVEALALARGAGDKRAIAIALSNLAVSAWGRSDVERARALLTEALALHRETEDARGAAVALNNLGVLARMIGDLESALAMWEEASAVWREIGDLRALATALQNFGNLAVDTGDVRRAQGFLREAVDIRRDLGDRTGLAQSLDAFAYTLVAAGELERAREVYRETVGIAREVGNRQTLADALVGLGTTLTHLGAPVEARVCLEDGLSIWRAIGDRAALAGALGGLGALELAEGRRDVAWAALDEALELGVAVGRKAAIAEVLEMMAAVAEAGGNPAGAALLLGSARAVRDEFKLALLPIDEPGYRALEDRLRAALGEEGLGALRAEGSSLAPADAAVRARS